MQCERLVETIWAVFVKEIASRIPLICLSVMEENNVILGQVSLTPHSVQKTSCLGRQTSLQTCLRSHCSSYWRSLWHWQVWMKRKTEWGRSRALDFVWRILGISGQRPLMPPQTCCNRTKTTWLLIYWQWFDRQTLWGQLPISVCVFIIISSCFLLRVLRLLFGFLFLLLQLLKFFKPFKSFLESTVKLISFINIQ